MHVPSQSGTRPNPGHPQNPIPGNQSWTPTNQFWDTRKWPKETLITIPISCQYWFHVLYISQVVEFSLQIDCKIVSVPIYDLRKIEVSWSSSLWVSQSSGIIRAFWLVLAMQLMNFYLPKWLATDGLDIRKTGIINHAWCAEISDYSLRSDVFDDLIRLFLRVASVIQLRSKGCIGSYLPITT